MAGAKKNWSANITYASDEVHEATSIAEIQALLKSKRRIKPFGTGHTFNSITDTLHSRLSLREYGGAGCELDAGARTVTVPAGVRYDELCPFLHERGFALANAASIMELSVVGAVSTAAHGSGSGNLATAVAALELVAGSGEVVTLSRRDGGAFAGAVVGLGALGVVTKLTLDVEPQFTVRQWVYLNLPIAALHDHFDAIMSLGYSVSLFTDWQDRRISQMWVKCSDWEPFEAPEVLFGTTRQRWNVNLNFGAHVEHCTEQMGVPGPSHERLSHFRPGYLEPIGKELQTEYFIPRRHAPAAILAIEALRASITPHLFISEVRSIAADEFWMSPCYGRDSVSIHFTWKHHEADVKRLVPIIEQALAAFTGVRCSPWRPRSCSRNTRSLKIFVDWRGDLILMASSAIRFSISIFFRSKRLFTLPSSSYPSCLSMCIDLMRFACSLKLDRCGFLFSIVVQCLIIIFEIQHWVSEQLFITASY